MDRVTLCNMALGHVGSEAEIEDFEDDDSEEARRCRAYFDQARRDALRAHPWGFANAVEYLADAGVTPVDPRWSFAYQYPSDCVKLLRLINPANPDAKVAYALGDSLQAGKVIYTNQPEAIAEYTRDVAELAKYDDSFVMALSYALGALIAVPLVGSRGKMRDCMAMLQRSLPGAQAADANEQQQDIEAEASYITARR